MDHLHVLGEAVVLLAADRAGLLLRGIVVEMLLAFVLGQEGACRERETTKAASRREKWSNQ